MPVNGHLTTKTAIILAAGRGSRLGDLTSDRPKCLIEINGCPLIQYQVSALRRAGISQIYVVAGYRASMLTSSEYSLIINDDWMNTNMVTSLLCAEKLLKTKSVIVSYSDIIYSSAIIAALRQDSNDLAVAYDPNWLSLWRRRMEDPLQDAETFNLDSNGYITDIGSRPSQYDQIAGQYMGLIHITPRGWECVIATIRGRSSPLRAQLHMTELLQLCITEERVKIFGVPNELPWCEIDTPEDLRVAEEITRSLYGQNSIETPRRNPL